LSSAQRKGSNYERELACYINTATGLEASRAPLSGGGLVDMPAICDIIGTPGLFIEAKRVERLNSRRALEQAERNATESYAPEHPVVIERRNYERTGDSLVHMRLDDFLELYKHYLKNTHG